jgi:hypothetical protein
MRDYQTGQKPGPSGAIFREVVEEDEKTLNRKAAGQTGQLSAVAQSVMCRPAKARAARNPHDPRVQRLLLQAQKTFGNRHVQRMMSVDGETEATTAGESVEQAIREQSGGGQSMDHGVRTRMEHSFGADFSRVRIHNDSRSYGLSRMLDARAFTAGHDIFFSENSYEPGSSSGAELLAHELTHVVQQNGSGIQTKLNVSEPQDPEEEEADKVARSVAAEQLSGNKVDAAPESDAASMGGAVPQLGQSAQRTDAQNEKPESD